MKQQKTYLTLFLILLISQSTFSYKKFSKEKSKNELERIIKERNSDKSENKEDNAAKQGKDNKKDSAGTQIDDKVNKSLKPDEDGKTVKKTDKSTSDSNQKPNDDEFEKELQEYTQNLMDNSYNEDSLNQQYFAGTYAEDKAHFFAVFAKAAKCYDKPTKLYFNSYKFYSAQSILRSNLYPYKTFIHVNEDLNRVVISIGGPRNLNSGFYNKLYSEDFEWMPNHQVLLEREFSEVYNTHIRHFLIKKIIRLKFEGFPFPEYVFNGHSIGGSLAIYAAFDLAKSGIINWRLKKPIVYSFGALRIGDASLATQVNKYADVWRITKQNDYLTRAPVCYYCAQEKRWNCKVDYFHQYQKYLGNVKDLGKEQPLKEVVNNAETRPDYVTLNDKAPNPYDYSVQNDNELSKSVFERNKKPYYYYAYFYNSAFNPNTKYFEPLNSKKDDILHLYFNVTPNADYYSKSPLIVENDKNKKLLTEYDSNNSITMVSPKIVESVTVDGGVYQSDADSKEQEINEINISNDNSNTNTNTNTNKTIKDGKLPQESASENASKKATSTVTTPKRHGKSSKYANYDHRIAPFVTVEDGDVNKLDKRLFRTKSTTLLDSLKKKALLMQLVKPEITVTPDSQLSDLGQYSNNYVYFTPPIGRQVFYTYDGKVIQCKRTYFGASTCELQYLLPKNFYSTSSHNNYLGVDFGDCRE